MSGRGAPQLPAWPLPAVGGGPVIEGWRTEQSGWRDALLIVTADESSVTAERCARSYATGADCLHHEVEWTRPNPLPEGARCRL